MKRLLLFVLLLGLGIAVLKFALGGESLATTRNEPEEQPTERQPLPGQPIEIGQGAGLGVGVRVVGKFQITQKRSIPTPTGSRFERLYELRCEDCEPADRGRHLLTDVRVKMFDKDIHIANLLASNALVELEIDKGGSKSLRQNKEIELSNTVLQSVPGSSLGDIRIELGRVRTIIEDDQVSLHTPDERQPIMVSIHGEHSGTLRGRGIRIRMPRSHSQTVGRLDLVILDQPIVETEGVIVRAAGSLHYVEAMQNGAGLLTLDRDVRVLLEPGSGSALAAMSGSRPIELTGDQLHGWMQRSTREKNDETSGDGLIWQMLRVTGSRARVAGAGINLESPRLSLVPGPTGEPYVITADGGQTDLHQVDDAGREVSFRSMRPVHLIKPDNWIGSVHRRFGFPSLALRPLRDIDVIVFEGEARLEAGDGVDVHASRGLRVFSRGPQQNGLRAYGLGEVEIARGSGKERVIARGNNGFELRREITGDLLVLGDDTRTSDQTFELVRGDVRITGRGACRTWRSDDDIVHLVAASDDGRATADLGTTGKLQNVCDLSLQIRGKDVLSFVASGPDLFATLVQDGKTLTAQSPRIAQIADNHIRLSMADGRLAELSLKVSPSKADPLKTSPVSRGGQLRAPLIDIHRVAARAVVLDAKAQGDQLATIRVEGPTQDGRAAGGTDVHARRIQLLPFGVGPLQLASSLTGLSPAITLLAAPTMAQPWLLATGTVSVHSDGQGGGFDGTGARLLLSLGTGVALLTSDPDTGELAVLDHDQGSGRSITARGAAVRLSGVRGSGDENRERIQVLTRAPGSDRFIPPVTILRDASRSEGSPFANLHGTCQGEIEVTSAAVLFHGPVRAHSLLPSGEPDPVGMHVNAQQLSMTRNTDTGKTDRVEASGGVEIDWERLWVRSDKIEIDLRWQRCIAEGSAELRLADGKRHRARRIEANYATYLVRSFFGTLTQDPEPIRDR